MTTIAVSHTARARKYQINSRQIRGEPREYWVEEFRGSRWVPISTPGTKTRANRIFKRRMTHQIETEGR